MIRMSRHNPTFGTKPESRPFGIVPDHEPVAIVLDFVNPVGAGRRLVGGGRKVGLDEFGVGSKAPTHTLDQHAANLGGRRRESSRCPFISVAACGLAHVNPAFRAFARVEAKDVFEPTVIPSHLYAPRPSVF